MSYSLLLSVFVVVLRICMMYQNCVQLLMTPGIDWLTIVMLLVLRDSIIAQV